MVRAFGGVASALMPDRLLRDGLLVAIVRHGEHRPWPAHRRTLGDDRDARGLLHRALHREPFRAAAGPARHQHGRGELLRRGSGAKRPCRS